MILTLPFVTVICSAVLCLLSFNFHILVGPLDVLPSAVEFNFFLYFDSYLANPGRSLQYIYIYCLILQLNLCFFLFDITHLFVECDI